MPCHKIDGKKCKNVIDSMFKEYPVIGGIPQKPCARSSCPNLTTETYCSNCAQAKKKEYYHNHNKEWQHLYGSKWQRARKSFLSQNPLCSQCLKSGITKAANVVDHKTPHKGDIGLFWQVSNWDSLCARCHNKKTAKEGAFGK